MCTCVYLLFETPCKGVGANVPMWLAGVCPGQAVPRSQPLLGLGK